MNKNISAANDDIPPASDAKILIVDDDADMRAYLVDLLEKQWNVKAAADGQTALKQVHEWQPELVLADVMMPGLDGFELLKKLRNDSETCYVSVILLSAKTGKESRIEGLEAGADDYMVKPVSADELCARIGSTLKLARLRQQADALQKSKDRFSALVSASSDVMFHLNADWTKMQQLKRQGFFSDTEENLSKWFESYIPHHEQVRIWEAFNEAYHTKSAFELQHQVIRKDGTRGWNYSRAVPIMDDGEIIEWFGIATDITERKRREERDQFFIKLNDTLRSLTDPVEIQHAVSRLLANHFEVDRAYYAEVTEGDTLLVARDYCKSGIPSIAGEYRLKDFGQIITQPLCAGETLIFSDVKAVAGLTDEEKEAYEELGAATLVKVPLVKEGRLTAVLGLHQSTPREWTFFEIKIIEEAAERTWFAVERARAEEALQESEEKYRTLFESLDEGFCIIKVLFNEQNEPVDYRFLEINPAFEGQTGLNDAEGKRMRELEPNHEEHWFETYGRIALTGKPERFTNEARQLGCRWYDVYAFRVDRPEERKVAVLFSDITERKRRKERDEFLLKLNDTLQPLTDPIGIQEAVSTLLGKQLNADSVNYSVINEAAEAIVVEREFRRENADSMIGTHTFTDFAWVYRILQREDNVVVEDVRSSPLISEAERTEVLALGVIGVVVVPLIKNGRMVGAITVISDSPRCWSDDEIDLIEETAERTWAAAERARAEEALHGSEARLRMATEAADMCAWEINLENEHLTFFSNAEDLLGIPAEALPENIKEKFDIIHHADRERVRKKFDQALAQKDTFVIDYRVLDAEAHVLWLEMHARILRDSEGNPEKLIAIAQDITSRKQQKKKLQQLNETLEERVEKRTATLLSYQKQLRKLVNKLSQAEEEARRSLAAELHDNLGQLLAICKMKMDITEEAGSTSSLTEAKDLLDDAISYTRQLMTDLKPAPSSGKESMAEEIRWLARKMKKHDLDVIFEPDEKQVKPLNTELQTTIVQCVRELLFNVVKHAGTSKAWVHLCYSDSKVKAVVEDKGTGYDISESELDLSDGNNFGLFNIRERIAILGGRMNINSNPGNGTKVSIMIPINKEDTNITEGQEPKSDLMDGEQYLSEIEILLVDDHEMMREGLKSIIESEDDMTVIAEASDGNDIINLIQETRPDVIVMDVNLPGMNGIEITEKVKAEFSEIQVVGLSLYDDEEVAEKMRNAGAAAYITKTEAFETLCTTIRSVA